MNGWYRPLTALLRDAGFKFVRQGKGSHELWSDGKLMLIVPFNCYSRHTANAVLQQAGIRVKL